VVFEQADWSERAAHMWERHRVLPQEADEALADPDRVVMSVIVHDATGYGVNGWPSNSKDRRLYRVGGAS